MSCSRSTDVSEAMVVLAGWLTVVFAIALELPTETFVEMHKFEEEDDSWFRCECISPFCVQPEVKLG